MKGIHIGEVLVEQGAITKEQLKYGLKAARRAPQFSKR